VLIADDHTLFREGLRYILDKSRDIVVVGESSDGIEALEKVRSLKPDIVLLDITMPKMSGIDTLKEIKSTAPKTQVIVLTMHAKDQYIHEVLVNGASGYVLKDSASEDLISAIDAVAQGKAYLSPSISKSVISHYSNDAKRSTTLKTVKEKLTKREKEILRMISQELTTKEIASTLYISHRTVENHRNNIMKKLGIHTKVGLVKYAIQTGLVSEV
jgi:two-component system response regulator NreC